MKTKSEILAVLTILSEDIILRLRLCDENEENFNQFVIDLQDMRTALCNTIQKSKINLGTIREASELIWKTKNIINSHFKDFEQNI